MEGFTLDTPTTADEAAEYFKQALLAGNVDAIQKVTSCIYEDWDDVTFDSIEYQTIAQDPVSSRVSVHLHCEPERLRNLPHRHL